MPSSFCFRRDCNDYWKITVPDTELQDNNACVHATHLEYETNINLAKTQNEIYWSACIIFTFVRSEVFCSDKKNVYTTYTKIILSCINPDINTMVYTYRKNNNSKLMVRVEVKMSTTQSNTRKFWRIPAWKKNRYTRINLFDFSIVSTNTFFL